MTVLAEQLTEVQDYPPEPRRKRVVFFERFIAFLAAIATIATFINSWAIFQQKAALELQEQALRELLLDASFLALESQIEKPVNNENIRQRQYHELHGAYHGRIPYGRKLVVFLKDTLGYKLVNPEPTHDRPARQWRQTNINFGSPGVYDIIVCLADETGLKQISSLRTQEVPDHIPGLPSGVVEIGTVYVNFNPE